MIETVWGAIPAETLGVTMCHEHLALDLSHVRGDTDSVFTDTPLIAGELNKLYDQGCRGVIEVTCNDMGRDVERLRGYSRATGLHIVASTGFYLAPYHPRWLHTATVEEIAQLFIHELTVGIGETGVRAGLIAEIATSSDCIHPTERKVFEAAAMASARTGCAISTHCDMGTRGLEQVQLLVSKGATPEKIILGHIDLADDREYHLALLKTGANLAFDTIGKTSYLSDQRRADNLAALLAADYEDKLLLSQDVSRLSYLTASGGRGYTAVLGWFATLLRERGITQAQLDKLLIYNPARILDRQERIGADVFKCS